MEVEGFDTCRCRFVVIEMEKRGIKHPKWLKDWIGWVSECAFGAQRSLWRLNSVFWSLLLRGSLGKSAYLRLSEIRLGQNWTYYFVFLKFQKVKSLEFKTTYIYLTPRLFLIFSSTLCFYFCITALESPFIAGVWNVIAALGKVQMPDVIAPCVKQKECVKPSCRCSLMSHECM